MPKDLSRKKVSNEDLAVKIDKLAIGLDHLAVSTAKGFEEVDQKISGAESRIKTELKAEITKVDSKVTNLQNRLDVHAGLDRQVEKLDKRVIRLEKEVGV